MRLIFVCTTGRSGTASLARLFKLYGLNCVARHDPHPVGCGKAMSLYDNGYMDQLRDMFARKIDAIRRLPCEVYIGSSQCYMKSFFSVACDVIDNLWLIHLMRDPLEYAVSQSNRNSGPLHLDEIAKIWHIGLDAKRLFTHVPNFELTRFQACLWEWFEVEARYQQISEVACVVGTFDILTSELSNVEIAENLLLWSGVKYDQIDSVPWVNRNRSRTVVRAEHVVEAKALVESLDDDTIGDVEIDWASYATN